MIQGITDLFDVTERLVTRLNAHLNASALWPAGTTLPAVTVSGSPPETFRTQDGTFLSLYLLHVIRDKFQTNNSYYLGDSTPVGEEQALPLDLLYLVTVWDKASVMREQKVMGLTLRWLHQHAIQQANGTIKEDFTLTLEMPDHEALGRVWQAFGQAWRLSALVKASVVFLSPATLAIPALPVLPDKMRLETVVTDLPLDTSGGQLLGTLSEMAYMDADSIRRVFTRNPAVVVPGEQFSLFGVGMAQAGRNNKLFLQAVGSSGSPVNVTGWILPGTEQTDWNANPTPHHRVLLQVPTVSPPAPGVYLLSSGHLAPVTVNPDSTLIAVAPQVSAAGGPVVSGSPLTLAGTGFIAGQTQVLLGTVALTETAGVPTAGEFRRDSQTQLTVAPFAAPTGRYPVRVIVNGVESPPAKWVSVP